MSLSAIAFSPALVNKSDEDQRKAIEDLQEYLAKHPDIWRPEKRIFESVVDFKPFLYEGEFRPEEKLHGQATGAQRAKIEKLGFTVLTPILSL